MSNGARKRGEVGKAFETANRSWRRPNNMPRGAPGLSVSGMSKGVWRISESVF